MGSLHECHWIFIAGKMLGLMSKKQTNKQKALNGHNGKTWPLTVFNFVILRQIKPLVLLSYNPHFKEFIHFIEEFCCYLFVHFSSPSPLEWKSHKSREILLGIEIYHENPEPIMVHSTVN